MDYSEQQTMVDTDAVKLARYWNLRNIQIQEDIDLINLVKPVAVAGKKNWVDNEPKVFFDTARALVSVNNPRFRLPLSINFQPDEKDKMNKAERFLLGIYRTFDNRMQERGECMWLWQLAYWVLLGWYAVFTVVQEGSEGIEFTADIWNPTTVYPEWNNRELVKCLRMYETDAMTAKAIATELITKGQLETTYIETDPDKLVKIVNHWRKTKGKVYNTITVAGQVIKPTTLQTKLTGIPIHIGAIGTPDRGTGDWQKRRGESIVAANRDMYEYSNVMMRLLVEIMDETAYPNIVTKTRSGAPPVKGENIRGHGSVIPLRLEDQIELLKHAAQPQEGNILLQYIANQKQKGALPSSVYGNLPFEISGFALSQLLAAVKYKLGPYINAMQSAVSYIMQDCLYQYKKGNFGKLTLSTTNPYDIKRGLTYIEEFGKDDIPERIFVETTIPITSQFDKSQAILNAVQASQSGILSRETLWEETLDVQDSEQEKQRLIEDRVNQDPFVIGLDIVLGLWKKREQYILDGNIEMAEALLSYIEAKEKEMGVPPKRQGQKALPGIPPQQLPPEMSGLNADVARAATGAPPPGLNRPPESPETRQAKQTAYAGGV